MTTGGRKPGQTRPGRAQGGRRNRPGRPDLRRGRGEPTPERPRWPRAVPEVPHPDRFGALLLVLVFTYLLSAFIASDWVSAFQVLAFVTVAGLAVRTGRLHRRTARLFLRVMIPGSAVALLLALTHQADIGIGLASFWTALVLLLAVVLIVRRVLAHPVVTMQSIYGAVSAYLIIGLMFAALYAALNRFGGGHFFVGQEPENTKTYQYFSFTTLTTLGYGDFTAANSGGRALAVMEALMGQIFLATLVARLVAAFRSPRQAQSDRSRHRRRHGEPRPRPAGVPARRGRGPLRRTSSHDRAPQGRRSPPRPGR